MCNVASNIKKCVEVINQRAPGFKPKIGIILGSGLGPIADEIENRISISYSDLPGFMVTNIAGHKKTLHLGTLKGAPVACLEGRSHLYEGVENATNSILTFIRTLKVIGCEILLTTNAVGSLRKECGPGSLVAISDHINLTSSNPLLGPNEEAFGPRFVSMDNAYDNELRKRILAISKNNNIQISEGVYLALSGPTFETHAEIRAYKMLGADIVGMSTVPETIIARHCGLKVASVSAVTNMAAGMSDEILSHEGTLKGATLATENMIKLFLLLAEEFGK